MENCFKFKKGDFEIEFSGEKEFVESQINSWKSFFESINLNQDLNFKKDPNENFIHNSDLSLMEENKTFRVKKNISIDDFLKLKEPKTDEDKVICVSYYFEKYEYYKSFTDLDIFKILQIDNIENLLEKNIQKGFLRNCEEKNNMQSYSLTYSGEIYVRDCLFDD